MKYLKNWNPLFWISSKIHPLRVIVIQGAGEKSFVAGADIAELSRLIRRAGSHSIPSGSVSI